MSKLLTTTSKSLLTGMRPVHPGEILLHEFLEPSAMSATALARALGMPPNRVLAIVNGTRGITAETALLLEAYFKSSASFWLNLQHAYELSLAVQSKALHARIAKVKKARRNDIAA